MRGNYRVECGECGNIEKTARNGIGIEPVAVAAFAGAKGIGVAVSAAANFEEQLLSLRSTVGESEENLKSIRQETMNLAAEKGQSTSKIVDGYRFARSAGLDLADSQASVRNAERGLWMANLNLSKSWSD